MGEVELFENYILSESVSRVWDLERSSFGHTRSRPLYWKKLETTTTLSSIAWNCLHSSKFMPHIMPNFGIPFWNPFFFPHFSCRCRMFQNKVPQWLRTLRPAGPNSRACFQTKFDSIGCSGFECNIRKIRKLPFLESLKNQCVLSMLKVKPFLASKYGRG